MEINVEKELKLTATNPIHPDQLKDLESRFTYHAPFGDLPARYELLRGAIGGIARLVLQLTPKGREQSLAITHLEEAVFWANAAIARGMKNPEEKPQ